MSKVSKVLDSENNKIDEVSELEKYITGKRNKPLNQQEIKEYLTGSLTNEKIFIIYKSLITKKVNPESILIGVIKNITSNEILILIALCIRNDASQNCYVIDPDFGTSHILVFIMNTLIKNGKSVIEENIIKAIISIFIISGSILTSPAFSKNGNKIEDEMAFKNSESFNSKSFNSQSFNSQSFNSQSFEPSYVKENSKQITVLEWFKNNHASYEIENLKASKEILEKYIGKELLTSISIYLDRILFSPKPYEAQDLKEAINSYSFTVWDKIPKNKDKNKFLDNKPMFDCVEKFCKIGLNKLFEEGMVPTYLLNNKIILQMKKYSKHIVILSELSDMLISSVQYGSPLDQNQYNMILESSASVTELTTAYNIPFWKKECKNYNNDDVSQSLKHLAISLGIKIDNKKDLCNNLSNMAKNDANNLITAYQRKQENKLNSEMGNVSEFSNGKTPNLYCSNSKTLLYNPYDYNDLDLSYYRDDQGLVWCFSSDTYELLLKSEKNINNQAKLPYNFLETIREKLERINKIKNYIEDNYELKTFPQAIESLSKNDNITNKHSNKFFEKFKQLASSNMVNVDTVKTEDYEKALKSLGCEINLQDLILEHVKHTVARIVLSYNNEDIKKFFENLKNMSTAY